MDVDFIFSKSQAQEAGFRNGRPCIIWDTEALWRDDSHEAVEQGGASYWSPRAGGVVWLNGESMEVLRKWDLPRRADPIGRHFALGLTSEIVERNMRVSNKSIDKTVLESVSKFDPMQSYANRAQRFINLCVLRISSLQYPILIDEEMRSFVLAFIGATETKDADGSITRMFLDELQDNKLLRYSGDRVIFLTKADQHSRDIRVRQTTRLSE